MTNNDPRTTLPSEWENLAQKIINDHVDEIGDWEYGFLESFLDRGFPTPTPRQREVFIRLCDEYGLECPDD